MKTTPPTRFYTGSGQHEHDRIAILVSRWNKQVCEKLYEAAETVLKMQGVARIEKIYVPGSYELPFAAQCVAKSQHFDAIICLGCILTGETKHNEYISLSVAQGIMRVALDYKLPIIFGVLTPNSQEQALERAGGALGNKGTDSAIAALEMIDMVRTTSF